MKTLIFILLLITTSAFGQLQQKPMMGTQIDISHPLSDPVGFWPMWESSGNKVFDLSGYGGDGTVSVFTWGVGKYGPCLQHTGANDQIITLPNTFKPLDGASAFTVRIICKSDAITTDFALFLTDQFSTNEPIVLWFDNAGTDYIAAIVTCSGGTTGVDFGTIPIIGGNWYDIVLTYQDGDGARLYLNGIEDTGFDGSGPSGILDTSGSQYHIGNDPGLNKDFQGSLDSCMLWNRALFASEVALFYSQPFCMFEQDDVALMAVEAPTVSIPVMYYHYVNHGSIILLCVIIWKKCKIRKQNGSPNNYRT